MPHLPFRPDQRTRWQPHIEPPGEAGEAEEEPPVSVGVAPVPQDGQMPGTGMRFARSKYCGCLWIMVTIATISVIIIATSIQDQPPLAARENLTMISADTDSSTLISLLHPERTPSANEVEVAVVGNGPLSHEDRQNISLRYMYMYM